MNAMLEQIVSFFIWGVCKGGVEILISSGVLLVLQMDSTSSLSKPID